MTGVGINVLRYESNALGYPHWKTPVIEQLALFLLH